jgi:FecR protein.
VEIWSAGAWRAAVAGPLRPGDAKLRTGPEARAELSCAEGVTATVGPDTELNLETLSAPPAGAFDVVLQAVAGIVGLVAPGPRRGRAELRAPLAIAAARGTAWLVQVGPEDASAVFVREGRVRVTPLAGGAPATLGPGEGVDVTADGAGQVVAWGAPRVAAARAALGFGWR